MFDSPGAERIEHMGQQASLKAGTNRHVASGATARISGAVVRIKHNPNRVVRVYGCDLVQIGPYGQGLIRPAASGNKQLLAHEGRILDQNRHLTRGQVQAVGALRVPVEHAPKETHQFRLADRSPVAEPGPVPGDFKAPTVPRIL